jgi:molecular chaperone DnaJ
MPVEKRDYYEVLGVSRTATDQELKSAYRQAALRHHPDRNPGIREAEERFKEAADAYTVLSDPQKRAAYDRYGHAGVSTPAGGFDPTGFPDLSEIFGEFFFGDMFGGGGRRGRNRAQRGEDLQYNLELSFDDAVRGLTAEIQIPRREVCGRCRGTGGEPEGGVTACPTCRGRGEIVYQQGFLSVRRTCSRCGGAGQVVRKPCGSCGGEGSVRRQRKLKIDVPAGVDSGTRLRLAGEGQPGVNGGPHGDLYVFMKVQEHAIFERRENDLHCTIPISMAQAALGAEIQAPTLDGAEPMKIPGGTESGTTLRLRHRGVPDVSGHGRGDLYIHLQVKTPPKLTREQRKLFEQLAEVLPVDNQPDKRGLFEKVKDYFM